MTDPEIAAPDSLRCYRHGDRETLVSCSECERPICTSCMRQSAVGVKCPDCAASGRPTHRDWSGRRLSVPSGGRTATTVLVVLNVIVFLAEMVQGVGAASGLTGSSIVRDGAIFGPAIADGEWWRLITGAFLHGGLIHIGFNMWLLWVLGGPLEERLGSAKMLLIYGASVLWGSFGALLFAPDTLTVGASGGVFGLMGAIVVLERQRGAGLMQSGVAGLLLLNLGLTFFIPGISIGGHLGGLAGGAAAAWVLAGFGRRSPMAPLSPPVAALAGAVVVGGLVAGLAVA